MDIITTDDWIFFINESYRNLDTFKMGKWMVYFSEPSREYVSEMCKKAVNDNIVPEAKVEKYFFRNIHLTTLHVL